ncbi:cytochrome P450 736A117-like isoform X2 [Rhododendron vialii]|uniref:cytochrome P450 736A117-like isoform X2 n=1 Tax=Rhododendron vialii TaxID=182163 RepID=UPI00265F5B99|nr:cytochrome P450 736A117-like isoform X2 [Rhododendron vialii]
MFSLPLLSFYSLPFFFFFFFLFFIFYLFRFFSITSQKNFPPSPPKLPILGNLHQLGPYPHRSLRSLAQKYGPLMLLHFGNTPVLVVSSSLSAREIMKTHDQVFSSRPKLSIARRLLYDSKDVAFSPYGDYWRQLKSICVLHLLSNKRVQSFRGVREEETALMVEKIRSHSRSSLSSLVNMNDMLVTLTNNIVCRVAMGRKYDGAGEGKKFTELLGGAVELLGVSNVGDYIPWLAWINSITGFDAKVDKVAKGMDEFLEGVVEERRNLYKRKNGDSGRGSRDSEETQDFVDILLEIERENAAGCSTVQRDTIKALIMDMLGGGTDTTATSLVWTMTELLRHPKVMKKLQNEVREIARGKPNVSEDDLGRMHYLNAVVKEALRIRAPVPLLIARESIQDVRVMGYDIAAGTQVLVNAWAIARDPLTWEDPEEFRPERFLNNSMDVKGQDFEFIPFGAGRRGCPGTLFAMNVYELALANVVHSFDLSLPSGEDLDMTENPGLVIHKKKPLMVVASPFSF